MPRWSLKIFEDLRRKLETLFPSGQSPHRNLNFRLRSRPYEQLLDKYRVLKRDFPSIHVSGEKESKSIGREVNYVVQYRVKQLAKEKGTRKQSRIILRIDCLKFLIVLTSGYTLCLTICRGSISGKKNTKKSRFHHFNPADECLRGIAYERILSKSKGGPLVLQALSVNQEGAHSLMRDFKDIRHPDHESSPVWFWRSDAGSRDKGSETNAPSASDPIGITQSMHLSNIGASYYIAG